MSVERNLLISILKLTKSGPVSKALVVRDSEIPVQVADEMLKKFCEAGFIQWKGKAIEASSNQRVKIAIHAIKSGADFERVCRVLEWIEFENIAAATFEANNFAVRRRFRFKWAQRRWEIDVLGCREPLITCVDCKHWIHGWRKAAITNVPTERNRSGSVDTSNPHSSCLIAGSWSSKILQQSAHRSDSATPELPE